MAPRILYERFTDADLNLARQMISRELEQPEIDEAKKVVDEILKKLERNSSERVVLDLLNTLKNNQLRYIIAYSGCNNLQESITQDILDVQLRGDEGKEKMARDNLLQTALFAVTTEPDKLARVTFS